MASFRKKADLLLRLRLLDGQLGAVERAIEGNRDLRSILQLAAAVRGALDGLLGELVEQHLRSNILPPVTHSVSRGLPTTTTPSLLFAAISSPSKRALTLFRGAYGPGWLTRAP